jgi:DNA-binding transcriptional LysR family regulator
MLMENFRLTVFRAVARHLSFSRAAEELLLTQPAVTLQIKALEEEMGVPLFDRSGGRIALTPGGAALLPYAEQMKTIGEQAITAIAAVYGDHAGELTVGASQTIAQYLLPTFIANFRLSHPKVHLLIRSGNTDAMLQALIDGRIQLALIEGPERRKDIHIEPFMQDHMVLVVPAAHEWANQEITIAELKREPLLTREIGSGSRRIIEQALAQCGVKAKDLTISMEVDSTEGLLNSVEAGLGVTFVSHWAVRNQLALGTLKIARVPELKLSRSFSMAYLLGPEPAGNLDAFRSFLKRMAHEMGPRRRSERPSHVRDPKL